MDLITTHEAQFLPLQQAQAWLKKHGLAAMLVRSTDRYFNEYVPKDLSLRYKLTGFDGSVGDALILTDSAHLYVDGRYALQARTQAKGFLITVTSAAQSIESAWLSDVTKLIPKQGALAYDPSTIDLNLYDRLLEKARPKGINLEPCVPKIIAEIFPHTSASLRHAEVFLVPPHISGYSVREKLRLINQALDNAGLNGFLVTKLDDCAWLTNMRSYYFPFQSALPGIAAVVKDKIIFGVDEHLKDACTMTEPEVMVVTEREFFQVLKKYIKPTERVGVDGAELSKEHELSLQTHNIGVERHKNPISLLKAKKNEKELLHLRSAFKKADQAVYKTQEYVVEAFEKGVALSESDVDLYIKDSFKKSGAQELSFRPICASGENGAIIHYGHPSGEKILAQNSLFLLDTGAYFEGGFATDLTRTFLAGAKKAVAQPWQKKMFTLVLKASIRGLCARIRRGTTGMQLDAIVRQPLWQAGLDFAHGTGHGVGINVHEFPPRIAQTSTSELLEGQVFSIEPGLYFAGLGGVRIENLATLVADPDSDQFLRVLPLTFCPLDERLIDHAMLDENDKAFLQYCEQEWLSNAPWPKLPPLNRVSF